VSSENLLKWWTRNQQNGTKNGGRRHGGRRKKRTSDTQTRNLQWSHSAIADLLLLPAFRAAWLVLSGMDAIKFGFNRKPWCRAA
jgi:hypothetical protein